MKLEPGIKINHLTVIKKTDKRQNRKIMWEVQCDCEAKTHFLVRSDALSSGRTKSCGCTRKGNINRRIDLTGQKHGHLTALYIHPEQKKQNQNLIWICQCDCGNLTEVSTANFKHTNSCGKCNKKSIGEEKIEKILIESNISFIKQYKFDTCRFKDTNQKARFDFYVDNKYLIEYDGRQHFYEDNGTKWEKLEYYKQHDAIKNQWCKENNIPLIRIPYTHLKDLSIKDLLLETSQFII